MRYYIDFCAGIGGFAYGAYFSGVKFDKHYFSEVENYAIKAYTKRFSYAIPLGDIRKIDYGKLPARDWFISAGFPCQPHSVVGKRQGAED